MDRFFLFFLFIGMEVTHLKVDKQRRYSCDVRGERVINLLNGLLHRGDCARDACEHVDCLAKKSFCHRCQGKKSGRWPSAATSSQKKNSNSTVTWPSFSRLACSALHPLLNWRCLKVLLWAHSFVRTSLYPSSGNTNAEHPFDLYLQLFRVA